MFKGVPLPVYVVANTRHNSRCYDLRQVFELQAQGMKIRVITILFVKCDASIDSVK